MAALLPKKLLKRLSGAGRDVLRAVPRLHPEAGLERVRGALVAASPDDQVHTFEDERGQVSEVAERILELVDGRRTVADIVSVLCDEFEVEPEACRADTVAFVKLLVEKKVLVLGP
ncbi:PqqD family protein [Hyalangium rubrum]|uniref:PqqD family protein n=1 Tax=Hyalangium rubrum TaxID=3103134 RepID=A0ABU5HEN6_9BACT|nr:PqqD family protein [Hyalangium sp. s54d21]MDY7231934.1 PqqD family protein [Hyalangium sp. s54d21]